MDVEIQALAEIDADCRTQHASLPLHGILVVNIACCCCHATFGRAQLMIYEDMQEPCHIDWDGKLTAVLHTE